MITIVVSANESEHNPQQASLKTFNGDHVIKPQFSGYVRSYSYSYYVHPEYSLPHTNKLQVFWSPPSPLVGTLAPQDTGTNTTIGR